jgi:hypothetical protein
MSAIDPASDFLLDTLQNGPRPAVEVEALARKSGISRRTLTRAGKPSTSVPNSVAARGRPTRELQASASMGAPLGHLFSGGSRAGLWHPTINQISPTQTQNPFEELPHASCAPPYESVAVFYAKSD